MSRLFFADSLSLPDYLTETALQHAENRVKTDLSAIHRTALGRNLRHEHLAFLLGFAPIGSHPSITDNCVPCSARSSVSITTAAMLGARGAANEDRREGGTYRATMTYRPLFGRTPEAGQVRQAKSRRVLAEHAGDRRRLAQTSMITAITHIRRRTRAFLRPSGHTDHENRTLRFGR